MVGKPFRDQRAKHPFDRDVHLGDEIDRALLVDLERPPELGHLEVAGADDGFDRGGEKDGARRH